MKSIVIVLFIAIISFKTYSQEKTFNVVIFLNDVLKERDYGSKLIVNDSIEYKSHYVIGDLSVEFGNSDKKNILESTDRQIKFLFSLQTDALNFSEFEVNLNRILLSKKFIVIRVYDLKSKKKRIIKRKGKKYDYNIDTDGYIILNI